MHKVFLKKNNGGSLEIPRKKKVPPWTPEVPDMNVAQQRWQQHKCWVPARQLFQRLGDVPTEGIPFMGLGGFGDGRMHQGGIIRSQNKDEQLTNQEKVECHMAFAPYSYSFWSSGVGRPAPSLKWPKCWISGVRPLKGDGGAGQLLERAVSWLYWTVSWVYRSVPELVTW